MKTYVINLDRRKDRLELLKIPFEWEKFSAFDGGKSNRMGAIRGCLKSHQTLLKLIQGLKLEEAIIFEDDVVLCENFEVKFNNILKNLPEDWDLLFLGGWNKGNIIKYAEGLNIAELVYTTHAYVIRNKFIDVLLASLHSKDKTAVNENDYKTDVLLANCLLKGKCFICNPVLAWQREGYSDIECIRTNNLHLR
jgi:GR25 family glycosyltransferase involved in LPS biosynthesis